MDLLTPAGPPCDGRRPELSVVVPVYNEQQVLPEFHRRLSAVLDTLALDAEIVYVNDGSSDGSLRLLAALHGQDRRVAVIDLSRNFGKEAAMSAGLDFADGDAVVLIDADLQDPPELIEQMLQVWREGVDVVLMRRHRRHRESWLKRGTAHAFYRVIGRVGTIPIPEDVGDFRLLSRRAVTALRRLPERSRFMKGLFAWIGYPTRALTYDRDRRHAGGSKYSYWRLWNFALEGITSFSAAPLKVASYFGLAIALVAFAFGVFIVVKTLLYGDPVPGFPTLVTVVLFLGGLQLVALGIIGEYLGRMFVEVKQRPLYLVAGHLPRATARQPPAGRTPANTATPAERRSE